MNSIGFKISNLRKQNNLSQEQLAQMLDVSRQSISKWERDEALPDIYNLEALANIFGVSIDSIVKNNVEVETSAMPATPILSSSQLNKREQMHNTSSFLLVASVAIYIISIFAAPFIMEKLGISENIFILIFGTMIVVATIMIIYSEILSSKAKRLYGDSKSTKNFVGANETSPASPTLMLSSAQITHRENLHKRANILLVVSIAIYITSTFTAPLMMEKLDIPESIFTLIFGTMIAAATAMIIYSSILSSKAKRLYGDLENKNRRRKTNTHNPYVAIVNSIALVIFLLLGFIFGLWHPSWLVFVLAPVISTMLYNRDKRKHSETTEDTLKEIN